MPSKPNFEKIKRPVDLIDPQVEVTKNQPFGRGGQFLDIYRAKHSTDGCPVLFQIHGDKDSLVPVKEARSFFRSLKEVSKQPVAYAEIKGAQHAFDMFPSVRSEHVKHGVEKFLCWLQSDQQS
jgi:acetyl esterase/lipase